MKSDVKIGDNRLVISRVFDAPRQRVFDAWKYADQLQRWWGCRMTTKVESTMDFRPGGAFAHKMHITGAGEMVYTGAYDAIVEPERIAYHANFGPLTSQITVEFIEQGAGTKVILTQEGFPSADLCPIVADGFTAALEKLDRLLVPVAA